MKLLIDIPDNTYDAIMARDWKNAGWLFSDELKAIHDGKPFVEELQEIRQEIEDTVLESLSDSGDDWFAAEKVNECIDIIDRHLEQYKEETE